MSLATHGLLADPSYLQHKKLLEWQVSQSLLAGMDSSRFTGGLYQEEDEDSWSTHLKKDVPMYAESTILGNIQDFPEPIKVPLIAPGPQELDLPLPLFKPKPARTPSGYVAGPTSLPPGLPPPSKGARKIAEPVKISAQAVGVDRSSMVKSIYPESAFKVDMATQVGMDCERGAAYNISGEKLGSNGCVVQPPPAPFVDSQEQPPTCEEIVTEENAPTIGSIGHPLHCGDACKYFRRSCGCKRGHACTRCHLCKRSHLGKWRRPTVAATAEVPEGLIATEDAAVDTVELEQIFSCVGSLAKSVGSIGHPYVCAPACRYIRRKGGCKDGDKCFCCHLCRWVHLA